MSTEMDVDDLREVARARVDQVKAQINRVKAVTRDLRMQREASVQEHVALGARIELLTEQINALEQPTLHELKMELGKLARMVGGY